MGPDVGRLVGYQRAEFKQASRLRTWLLATQFAVALPAAISVFFDNGSILYYLAVIGAALLVVWWLLDGSYQAHRTAAENARRAALVVGGLGQPLSSEALLHIEESFLVTEDAAKAAMMPGYFASTAPAGPQRLAEMIDESAFFTEKLQAASAKFMGAAFALIVLAFSAVAGVALPYASTEVEIVVARVFLAILAFLLSSDVIGAARGHHAASRTVRDIRLVLEAASARGYPRADILLAMADYNAAVEAAPLTVPIVYRSMGDQLNRLWQTHLERRRVAAEGRS